MSSTDPPVDVTGRVVLIVGGAFLFLFLGAALLMVYGTSRCCGAAEGANQAQLEPIQSFLDAVARAPGEEAYEILADTYRQQTSKNEFLVFLRLNSPLFEGGTAMFLRKGRHRGDPSGSIIVVQIQDPETGTVKGVATFTIDGYKQIEEINVGDKIKSSLLKRQARSMLQHHFAALVQKDDASAYRDLDVEFAASMDTETFTAFADNQPEVFREHWSVRIKNFEVRVPLAEAEVLLFDQSDQPRQALIYNLRRVQGIWKITGIKTLGEVDLKIPTLTPTGTP